MLSCVEQSPLLWFHCHHNAVALHASEHVTLGLLRCINPLVNSCQRPVCVGSYLIKGLAADIRPILGTDPGSPISVMTAPTLWTVVPAWNTPHQESSSDRF